MTKRTLKLALRKEMIRALTEKQLRQAVGGLETDAADAVAQSRETHCPVAALVVG